jgi:hypothetical protein
MLERSYTCLYYEETVNLLGTRLEGPIFDFIVEWPNLSELKVRVWVISFYFYHLILSSFSAKRISILAIRCSQEIFQLNSGLSRTWVRQGFR